MRQIQPVQVWKDGENQTATQLDLRIIHDDLATSATLYYQLKSEVENDTNISYNAVAEGNHTIAGEDYTAWGATGDINAETYQIVADKLNLELI